MFPDISGSFYDQVGVAGIVVQTGILIWIFGLGRQLGLKMDAKGEITSKLKEINASNP